MAPPCAFIGDAVEAYGDVFRRIVGDRARLLPSATHPPSASAVAVLAALRLARSPIGDELATLAPRYVRPPEAELNQSLAAPSVDSEARVFVDKVPIVY